MISQIYFDKELCMFRTDLLSIIRSLKFVCILVDLELYVYMHSYKHPNCSPLTLLANLFQYTPQSIITLSACNGLNTTANGI
jgi:hypothetical protein